ncbi:MAG TPA: redoxin family protein [Balneolaceae bacterium]
MKIISRFIRLFAVMFAFQSTVNAQQQTVTIQPEHPKPNQKVTITYHLGSPDAVFTSADSLKLVLSFAPYLPHEMEMKKTDEGWKKSFKISEQFKFASFYFKSGEKKDKSSDGHHYEFFIYEDGKPVQGAYLWKANSYLFGDRYEEISDDKLANLQAALYIKELALYPDSYDAQIELFAFQLDQKYADTTAIRERAHKLISKKLSENPGSFMVLRQVQSGYRAIGEEAKADSLEKALIEKYPQSDVAMYNFYQKASDKENEDKQAKMFVEYMNSDYDRSYINKYYTERAQEKLFEYYAEKGNTEKMKEWAQRWLNPELPLLNKPIKSSMYNDAARTIAENSEAFSLAFQYAEKALHLTDNEPVRTIITRNGRIVRYLSKDRTAGIKKSRKSAILATMGYIYLNQKEYAKAKEYFTKASELSDSDYTKTHFARLYMETDRPQKAYDIYWEMLMDEPTDEEIREKLKKAYIAYNGSEQGFEEETEELNEAWRQQMTKKFNEERLDKEAPSLEHITDLEGNPVDISTLKNKVIVVDLWATWCSPCLSAFPYLQKVYDEYKDNPDVRFVVLNSAWSNTIEDARKWQKENDYTFPLYYDKGSKVTEAFGVRGIPATFFIGRDGNIQFEKVGFGGAIMEPKMKLRLEMLLEEDLASKETSPEK